MNISSIVKILLTILALSILIYLVINAIMPPTKHNNGSNPVAILIYGNSCPHCKVVLPIWDKLIENYNGNKKIEKYEYYSNTWLTQYDVKGVPDIRFYKNGLDPSGTYITYEGKLSYNELNNWINNM